MKRLAWSKAAKLTKKRITIDLEDEFSDLEIKLFGVVQGQGKSILLKGVAGLLFKVHHSLE